MSSLDEQPGKGAHTENLFREINERIVDLTDTLPGVELMCECVNERCKATVVLAQDEYEAVRRSPSRFVVTPGHVAVEIERTVESYDRYLVVEKIGEAGKTAARLDPR